MADLSIDGEIFNVVVQGETTKPALVLAHTLGTTLALWEPQMPALLKHFRVIRYDSRGHGGSTDGLVPYSIGRLGRDVLAILDALEIERAHFVGMSMGGAVGQWLLVNAPDRIERAVLANTAARLSTASSWNARIRSVLAGDMNGNAEKTIERWFSTAFRDAHTDIVEAFRTTLRTMSPAGYAASCAALRDMDFREALRAVRHPVLVISGSDDPVTSTDDIALMTAALPNAKHVALAARHVSNIEAADAFTDEVVKFLTDRAPVRSRRRTTPPVRSTAPSPRGRRIGARTSVAARRPAAVATTKTSSEKTSSTRTTSATRPTRPKPAVSTGRTAAAKAVPAARKPEVKPVPTGIRPRKAVTPAAAAPGRRAAPKSRAAPLVTPKRAAKQTAAKATPGKLASRNAAVAKSSRANRAKLKTAPRSAAKGASSRRPTPMTAAQPAKTAAAKKAVGKRVAPKSASKAPRKSASAKPPMARRKSTASRGRPAGRGKGRGNGRGKS